MSSRRKRTIVLKLGGELLERPDDVKRVAAGIVALESRVPLVVVHGGGREIDAALAAVMQPGATELEIAQASETLVGTVAPLLGPMIEEVLLLQLL